MEKSKSKSLLRWFVLIVIAIHVLYNELFDLLFPQSTIASISAKYKSLFTPAGYTFSIWGVIYIALIIYGIYQVLPSQRDKEVYNKIALPLMISLLLGVWWNISFHLELIGFSEIAIFLMLISAFYIYKITEDAIFQMEINKIILVPFSLYFGWLTVANVASFTTWLVYIGSKGSVFGELDFVRILMGVVVVAAIIISGIYWDYWYILTIAWGYIGVYMEKKNDHLPIALAAFVCSVVLIIWGVVLISVKRNPRSLNSRR